MTYPAKKEEDIERMQRVVRSSIRSEYHAPDHTESERKNAGALTDARVFE